MNRIVIFGLVLLMTMAIFHEANAQICTHCLSGGYCPCSHPQCCIYNGIKACCRNRVSLSGGQLNTDTETITSKKDGNDDAVPRMSLPLTAK